MMVRPDVYDGRDTLSDGTKVVVNEYLLVPWVMMERPAFWRIMWAVKGWIRRRRNHGGDPC
jgi:hypothetical protein